MTSEDAFYLLRMKLNVSSDLLRLAITYVIEQNLEEAAKRETEINDSYIQD
jgi:hypothetical protein